jgi:membrane protein YdbS with pleckstrin-like domain
VVISFVLDWASFVAGVVTTLLVSFIGLFVVAGLQYRKHSRGTGRRGRI